MPVDGGGTAMKEAEIRKKIEELCESKRKSVEGHKASIRLVEEIHDKIIADIRSKCRHRKKTCHQGDHDMPTYYTCDVCGKELE